MVLTPSCQVVHQHGEEKAWKLRVPEVITSQMNALSRFMVRFRRVHGQKRLANDPNRRATEISQAASHVMCGILDIQSPIMSVTFDSHLPPVQYDFSVPHHVSTRISTSLVCPGRRSKAI